MPIIKSAGVLHFGLRTQELTARALAEHKAALGPVYGRAADADATGDLLLAGAAIRCQQNLRAFELARPTLAAAQQCGQLVAFALVEFDPIAYIHPRLLWLRHGPELNRMLRLSRPAKTFTPKQGQYLAFINLYMRLHRRPPAETDMQQYFRVSPPSVHQMVLTLERRGFIRRQPRTARSIELLVDPKLLPELL